MKSKLRDLFTEKKIQKSLYHHEILSKYKKK